MDRASFARDLAQALRDAEEQHQHEAEDPLDVLHRTYQRLCHDDPEAISGRGAQLLREALVNVESPYALSARLVRGIQQQCNNSSGTASAPSQSQESQDSTATETTTEEPLLVSPTAAASNDGSSVYAPLAWTVHAHLPLLCIRTRKLSEAVAYLGSFVETNRNAAEQPQREVTNNEADAAPEQQQQDANLDAFLEANGAAGVAAHPHNGITARNGHQHNGDEPAAAAAVGNGHTEASHIHNADNDSLAEVFAAESDDSDFEFESDWNPNEQVAALQDWAESVQEMWDPLQLSKHNGANADSMTWNDVAASVTELLQTYSSSAVAALNVQSHWKTLRCSELLTELIVALLVPSAASRSPLLTTVENSTNDDYTPDHWRRLGLHMLQLFAAYMQHHCLMTTPASTANTSTATSSLLEDYLRLLRILMQSSSPSVSKASATTETEPAVFVGLGSLSALCSEVLSLQRRQNASRHSAIVTTIQATVLESCDDLADWLEAAAITKTKDDIDANEAVQGLQWTYLSLFQILTQPSLNSSKNNAAMPSSTAQTLLNSGLLRQWLLVLETTAKKSKIADTTATTAAAVQTSIWELCLASPTLLGKYAWRFPGLAEQVTDGISEDGDSRLQVFLWNLLGIHLASLTQQQQTGAAPKVHWKSTKISQQKQPQTESRVVTAEACRQMAWSLFQSMCHRALQVLTDWKLRCEHQLGDTVSAVGGSKQQRNQQQQVLLDFGILADRLTVPLLRTLFVEQMVVTKTGDGGKDSSPSATTIIHEELQPIQRILSQWPSAPSADFVGGNEDSDDDEKEAVKEHHTSTDIKKKQRVEKEEIVNALRKSVKTILSALDDDSANNRNGRQHQPFSSKAD